MAKKATGQNKEVVVIREVASYKQYDSVSRSYGSRTFNSTDPATTVRNEYNKSDYEYYRRGEGLPVTQEGLIAASQTAYERVSIVRSVIDMMGDFTVQGIRIAHPNRQIESFLRDWKHTVGFDAVSERIANMLYRTGNCPVKKRFGKVPVYFEKEWRKALSDMTNTEEDIVMQKPQVKSRTLPLSYTVLDPLSIEVIGGEISAFVGKPLYGLKLSQSFKRSLINLEKEAAKTSQVNDILKFIPDEIKTAIKGGKSIIPLDPNKLTMLFYKKDDWKPWATPMIAAILDALVMLEKMHLADASALDGVISSVRLWTLGDIEHGIFPEPEAVDKLRDVLSRVGTGGTLDLVWGPELKFQESSSQVHHYLSSDKYAQVMAEIYSGLGVPQTLTGGSNSSNSGFTNNFISMKTLIERLEYGRKIITEFWNDELKHIQKAMGWRFAPKCVFDYKVLSEESTERALLLDMWDRDIMSTETMQELCRRDPLLEEIRIKRDMKKRDSGKVPPKASPFHAAEKEYEMKKLAFQGGTVTPSEVGVKLGEKKEGEKTPQELKHESQLKIAVEKEKMRPRPIGAGGRPTGKKDKKKRKTKKVTPRSSAFNLFVWAETAQDKIAEIISPAILNKYNKKNMRSLTKTEAQDADNMKFIVLSHLDPYSQVSAEIVYNILSDNPKHDPAIYGAYAQIKALFEKQYDKTPTLEDCREMFSSAYAKVKARTEDN